jgi:superfamily II DNA or RNA helicase
MRSIEDDALGEEQQVLWELEAGTEILESTNLPEPHAFDPPAVLDAFMHAVMWGAVSRSDQVSLQAPFRSGVDIEEYQLDPLVRALTMPRVNLLIADDVGLGKTIEAGLVVQELLLRHRARTVLILCPSALQVQWQEEMRDKFGLEFRIINSDTIGQLRRKRGIHVNPWTHFPRLIASIDFFKQERVLRSFRDTLPQGSEPRYPRKYDVLIVDEAHNVAPSGTANYSKDSQRTQAIRTLTPHFEHKLFLSATPHNGYSESFSALLELLDDQRFARAVPPNREQLEAIMVRRLKSELRKRWDGKPRFAERNVEPILVTYTDEERTAHRTLNHYANMRVKHAANERERVASEFVLKLLKKRLFSSPAAFEHTLEQHISTLSKPLQRDGDDDYMRQRFESFDDDVVDDDDFYEASSDVLELAASALSQLSTDARSALDDLQRYAHSSSNGADSKAQALLEWLDTHLKNENAWQDTRVIIFTEYRDTQNWLYDLLARYGFASQERLEMIHGGTDSKERERIKAAFQAHPDSAPVRILLATDAASEGLNLQNHCSKLIHYEIPWNPNRMEQRNGRIDRHGQRAQQVDVYHFVGADFNEQQASKAGELEGDLEFLMRAALKVNQIREDLGKVGPVIASQVEEAMLGKRQNLDTDAAENDAKPIRQLLKFERDLQKRLEQLQDAMNKTRDNLEISADNICHVVNVGLELAEQPPLQAVDNPRDWGCSEHAKLYTMPNFAGSWERCNEGLRHPHTDNIRPITFAAVDAHHNDQVVLVHLNHPLVQMVLRLLRAEVWSADERKLQRVTAKRVPDSVLSTPAVIAHGRIVVLGGQTHRLHEEVIHAGGVLVEGRFRRMNVGDTQAALNAAISQPVPASLHQSVQELWDGHKQNLLAALEARMRERTKNLGNFLEQRQTQEVTNLTTVMQELEHAIRAELGDKATFQPNLFNWTDSEKQQLERNLSALRVRLEQLPAELERETANIRTRYQDPTPRLMPLAITYLFPESIVRDAERHAL